MHLFLIFIISCFGAFFNAERVNSRFEERAAPYLLPEGHPLREWLDATFSTVRILESEATLREAGFEILTCLPKHPAVVKHPSAPGYVFKMYLNSEKKYPRENISSSQWLLYRCIGADILRQWIEQHNIQHFVVPEKRLYVLSCTAAHPVVLIATDMEIEDRKETCRAWKTLATKEHLTELYSILEQGYGSVNLPGNIPYTKHGKFAFIDTEKIRQKHKLRRVKRHLAESMHEPWDQLTHKNS